MASVNTRSPDDRNLARVALEAIPLPLPNALTTVRIEPPRGSLEPPLREVWLFSAAMEGNAP
jgi:hypothetical protein